MRLCIILVALFLASCSSPVVRMRPPPAWLTAAVSGSGTLNVKIQNRGSRTLEYAWPLAMASEDRSPVECPLPTTKFVYETHVLAPNSTKQLRLEGWENKGYVGVWTRTKGSSDWRIAWS